MNSSRFFYNAVLLLLMAGLAFLIFGCSEETITSPDPKASVTLSDREPRPVDHPFPPRLPEGSRTDYLDFSQGEPSKLDPNMCVLTGPDGKQYLYSCDYPDIFCVQVTYLEIPGFGPVPHYSPCP